MKFKQYINELAMKSDTEIEWIERSGHGHRAWIKIKIPEIVKYQGKDFEINKDILFKFNISKDEDNASNFNFPYKNEIVKVLKISFTDFQGWDKINKKGKNVALKLFAAIEHIFRTEIPKIPHDAIEFYGDKDHQKLYNLLSKKLVKAGYIRPVKVSGSYYLVKKSSMI